MRKVLKHYFVPHEGNGYRPHLFSVVSITVLALLASAVFVLSLGYSAVLSRIDYLANVLPSVLVDLANEDRSLYKLIPLARNPLLEAVAQEKANDMAKYSYFAHVSPTGITPWYWFTKNRYRFLYAGENLAVNFSDSSVVNQAWMNSPGHRANILNQQFTEIGIATAEGIYQGRPTTFVAQYFGRPIPSPVVSFPVAGSVNIARAESSEIVEPRVESLTETNLSNQPTSSFIAVKNAEIVEPIASVKSPVSNRDNIQGVTQYATLQEKVLSSPNTILRLIYLILLIIVLFAIVLSLFIEIKHHHGKHIITGLALVVFVVVLAYIYQHITGTSVAII